MKALTSTIRQQVKHVCSRPTQNTETVALRSNEVEAELASGLYPKYQWKMLVFNGLDEKD